jgi:hypothetical protein
MKQGPEHWDPNDPEEEGDDQEGEHPELAELQQLVQENVITLEEYKERAAVIIAGEQADTFVVSVIDEKGAPLDAGEGNSNAPMVSRTEGPRGRQQGSCDFNQIMNTWIEYEEGGDLSSARTASMVDCEQLCCSDPECKHYSVYVNDPSRRENCYLRKSDPHKARKMPVVTDDNGVSIHSGTLLGFQKADGGFVLG